MEYKFSRFNIIKNHGKYKVLYNSYSKSSLIFDENTDLSYIDNDSKIESLNKDLLNEYIDNGIIIDKSRDEIDELRYAFLKKYFDKSRLTVGLIPTLNCNFNCPYCCEKPFSCGKENLKNYFNTLKKFSQSTFGEYRNININLFGGEPLLYYNYANEYLQFLKKLSKEKHFNYSVSMITNGSLITNENLDFLLKHNLNLIQITLDSDKENHDRMRKFKNGKPSFDLLIKNIELVSSKIKNKKVLFVVRINLNNTSVEKVKSSLNEIEKKYRSNIHLMFRVIYNTRVYIEKNSNRIDRLEEYIKMSQDLGFKIYDESYVLQTCEAGTDIRSFYILPNLKLSKCANELGHESCWLGELNDDGSVKLYYENLVKWFDINYEIFNNKKCLNCKLLPDCLGGCPLYKIKNGKRSCRSFDMVSLPNYYGVLNELD